MHTTGSADERAVMARHIQAEITVGHLDADPSGGSAQNERCHDRVGAQLLSCAFRTFLGTPDLLVRSGTNTKRASMSARESARI